VTSLHLNFANFDSHTTPRKLIPATELPPDAVPVTTNVNGTFLRVIRSNTPARLGAPVEPRPASTFQAYVNLLPSWQQELLQGISCSSPRDLLGQHLLSSTRLLFCTDGGAKQNKGSFGWIISTNNEFLWECHGIAAPGWFTNSFRSEGIGQLATLVFFEAYLDFHQLHDTQIPIFPADTDPWIRMATDNQGLISRIMTGLAT
jgi:hypothetical protein